MNTIVVLLVAILLNNAPIDQQNPVFQLAKAPSAEYCIENAPKVVEAIKMDPNVKSVEASCIQIEFPQ